MPTLKEQMNVWISKESIDKARRCASVQRTSLNQWVQRAIEAQSRQDYVTYQIEELAKDLSKVARQRLPDQPASLEEMLAMAKVFASEDTEEDFETRHVQEESSRTKRAGTPRPSPRRKKR